MKQILSIIVLSVIISACSASIGKEEITELKFTQQLISEKTTQDDVLKIIGKPAEISFMENGNEIWQYYYEKSQPLILGTEKKIIRNNLLLVFDSKGILQSKRETENEYLEKIHENDKKHHNTKP